MLKELTSLPSDATIVMDFDGTCTDLVREKDTFYAQYYESLQHITGVSYDTLTQLMKRSEQIILAAPHQFGWENQGVLVAPATADPYLYIQAQAKLTLEFLSNDSERKRYSSEVVNSILNQLFYESYPKAGVFFRPDAKRVLQELQAITNLVVVTNSKTESVQKKIHQLLGENTNIQIVGNAKKFVIDHEWLDVPPTVQPPGFPRPVQLRRREYYTVLNSLGNVVCVVGDIYELDLSLPQHLKMFTILVTSQFTPEYEVEHLKNHSNGCVVNSLSELMV